MASLASRREVGEALALSFLLPADLARFVAEKGSIALNGVSMTVNAVRDGDVRRHGHPHHAGRRPTWARWSRAAGSTWRSTSSRATLHAGWRRARARVRRPECPARRTIDPKLTERVAGAIADVRAGKMVILVDDEDRENEGDLTMAAEFVTPEAINFMATHGRGLICVTLTEEQVAAPRAADDADARTRRPPARHRVHGQHRGAPRRDDRHQRRRPRAHHPRRRQPGRAGRATSSRPATSSRCARARAACWCAPGRPRARSISRASPVSRPPASSARS